MRRVVVYGPGHTNQIHAPITEFLDAVFDADGLRVWCEIDPDLPPVTRVLTIVRAGVPIPSVERPKVMTVETFQGAESVETGEVEVVWATYIMPVRVVAAEPAFLYGMVVI